MHSTYAKLGDNINVTLVGYGNAKTSKSIWGKTKVTCQHGETECQGLIIEDCAMHHYPALYCQCTPGRLSSYKH